MRAAAVACAVLAFAGTARAQYIMGEEFWTTGSDLGFFIPPVVGAAPPPTPTFDLVAGSTTPNDLSDSLTVNSTPMTLVLACDAEGISGTNWTCRDSGGAVTLAEAGTGSSPATTINTPFHALDSAERGVRFAASGKYYEAATTSVGQIGAEDAVIELVTIPEPSCTGSPVVIGTNTPGAGAAGWGIIRGTTNCRGFLSISDGTTTTTGTGAVTTWAQTNHTIYAIDSGVAISGAPALNGAAPSSLATTVADTTSVNKFRIGSAVGSTTTNTGIVSVRIWKCTNCITSLVADVASIARQRTATAFGVAPSIAAGTAAPTTISRATNANVDVVDGNVRHIYTVGINAPRVARRTHSGGTVVVGWLDEIAASNIALQSQTLGTTWTAITVGDNVLADAFAGADLTTTGDDIDGNNSSAEHGLRQSITLTAATYTFSAWAKAGAQSFVALRNATIANGTAWFDVNACTSSSCTIGEDCAAAVKTVQAGVIQARAERWPVDTSGDGVADVNLCRVSISYTGTAVAHNHDLLCAPSDNVLTYTDADATADCGFWGVRVEAFPTMTSYLATTTAIAARYADDLRYDGASHYTGSPSTMDVAVLCPSFDTTTATFASVGTGSANYARAAVDATERARAEATVTTAQWDILAGAGDVTDGAAHSIRQTMETNNVTAYYDGASIGTDATATLPTVASSFVYLGTAGSTANASACLISRTRLWSSLVAP